MNAGTLARARAARSIANAVRWILRWASLVFVLGCHSSSTAPGPSDLVIVGDTIRVGDKLLKLGEPLQHWKDVLGQLGGPDYVPDSLFHEWRDWGVQATLANAPGDRPVVEQVVALAHIRFQLVAGGGGGNWVPEHEIERRVFIGDFQVDGYGYLDRFYWTPECILWAPRKRFQPDYRCESDEVILELYTHGRRGEPAMLTVAMPREHYAKLSRTLTPEPPRPRPPEPPPTPQPYADPYLPKIDAPIIEP